MQECWALLLSVVLHCSCSIGTSISIRYCIYIKETEKVFQLSPLYPDPGSNRDGLPHWCLRPARLPIPPSGQLLFLNCECKGNAFFYICKEKRIFFEKSCKDLHITAKRSNFASRLLSTHTMGERCFRSLSFLKDAI